ncbi:DUF5677 domain-containing protein [Actinobacillus pleuropneumoniae]|uniref:DUF5677 domain-containing protein n=1 Tax=Actinobacillus pleuropneumoniae TaxID=715 RepID=A0A9Q4DIU8_ACTPL|nr:DUF5677 domain-containing protein [Actinobacillus pleuropneumoniae]MCL7721199.1 DUF5677 domain-containing protein [Actinobacillus pleuropneumoniae]MCL7727109.1 DUF5677 domain-containing protein [Actinobacillus pleuropneumoniae]MCL7730216.1 DUF5677 domain-containing protein [Actinobacillus pleuropneumoniae]MCY6368609.1 DUF5677 domain-containing protein [Actinobacillus pleuropneumoniae]MCY6385480.1 DUF5677 domain-containing protein [Actinobacillus pleuropneumoniae]
MEDTDLSIEKSCHFFEENFNLIKDRLTNIKKEQDITKKIFLLHSLSLYKEIYFLLKNHQVLSIPIVLRSALECFLKLNDIHCNSKQGINRIRISDYKEKKRLYSVIKEVEPKYNCRDMEDIEQKIDELKNNIATGEDNEFRLTKQAISYNKDKHFMKEALFLLSKHTHCNESLVTTLHHICGCNDIFVTPIISDEMQLEFLKMVNFFFEETIAIYNSMTDSPIFIIHPDKNRYPLSSTL